MKENRTYILSTLRRPSTKVLYKNVMKGADCIEDCTANYPDHRFSIVKHFSINSILNKLKRI